MKPHRLLTRSSLAALIGGLLLTVSAQAAITGINSGASSATIVFNDLASLDPSLNPGVTVGTASNPAWNGSAVALPLTTDPVTFDFAQGGLLATFGIPGPNDYAVSLNGVSLNQILGNSGFALLTLGFTVEYQLDAAGLPLQPTLFPNFAITGTVLTPSSLSGLNGTIDYYGVNAAGVSNLIDTVTYTYTNNTPGTFSTTVFGVPNFGNTPALGPNSTLTLVGSIVFRVDPPSGGGGSINAETVPEPSTWAMLAAGAGSLLVFRRRRG